MEKDNLGICPRCKAKIEDYKIYLNFLGHGWIVCRTCKCMLEVVDYKFTGQAIVRE
jgi:hypothetical protein